MTIRFEDTRPGNVFGPEPLGSGIDHSIIRFDGNTGRFIENCPTFRGYDDGTISNPSVAPETQGTTTERFGFGTLAVNVDFGSNGVNNAGFGRCLSINTTGRDNSAFGISALNANIIGSDCSAFGSGALLVSTASGNSAFGSGAGNQNTSGSRNSWFGAGSGLANQSNDDNAGFGWRAGLYIEGHRHSCFGSESGSANNINSNDETCSFGYRSLYVNQTGQNSAFGAYSMLNNTSGGANTSMGWQSMKTATTGSYNSAFGLNAMIGNTMTGDHNNAFGYSTMSQLTSGSHNCAFGDAAGTSVTTQSYNSSFGDQAGYNNSGDYNSFFGAGADSSAGGIDHATAIGAGATVATSNAMRFGTIGTYTTFFGFGVEPDSSKGFIYVKPTTSFGYALYIEGISNNSSGIYMPNVIEALVALAQGPYGVDVEASNQNAAGGFFKATHTSGNGYGVIGQSNAAAGYGGFFIGDTAVYCQAGTHAINIANATGDIYLNGNAGTSGTDVLTSAGGGTTPTWTPLTITQAETNEGITPVADGTYTVGAPLTLLGTTGTITTVKGIVTAVQQAT